MTIEPAKIIEQRSYLVPGGLEVTEHHFHIPCLHYQPPSAVNRDLHIFARSVMKHEVPVTAAKTPGGAGTLPQPWLLFLNGGPGGECPAPQLYNFTRFFVEKGYRVLFLDQRGTGLSSPLFASTLEKIGNDTEQAEYLKAFRADSIVRDSEAIRKALTAQDLEKEKLQSSTPGQATSPTQEELTDRTKWSILGQSFGGFCCITYLSSYPEGLREVFMTGGLAPITQRGPDEVYTRLLRKLEERNKAYYCKFPEDLERVKRIVKFLGNPNQSLIASTAGGYLTPRRFMTIGMLLGSHGGMDRLHEIVLRADTDLNTCEHLTRGTLSIIESSVFYENNILYAILHEPLYCQGEASNWSASRMMAKQPQFSLSESRVDTPGAPLYFTAEQILPELFTASMELCAIAGVAEKLAQTSDWPALYDLEKLRHNTVPVYATIFEEDLYVDVGFAGEAAQIIKGCKVWRTNRVYHGGLREKDEEVCNTLWEMRTDVLD